MKFWDSSALVALVADEEKTAAMIALFRADRNLIISFITPIEITAAIARQSGVNADLRHQAQLRSPSSRQIGPSSTTTNGSPLTRGVWRRTTDSAAAMPFSWHLRFTQHLIEKRYRSSPMTES